MLGKLNKILISGRCFTPPTEFQFFGDNGNARISLVYGKNGSGKSTIANALQQANNTNESTDLTAILIDNSGSDITSQLSDKISVFNEDFIDKNIKIESVGLNTIVLFGEQVGLQKEIDNTKSSIAENVKHIEQETDALSRITDKNNSDNPDNIEKGLIKFLKGSWAEVHGKIKGYKNNASVNGDLITEIGELKVEESETDLLRKFEEYKTFLDKTKDSNPVSEEPIRSIPDLLDLEEKICSLLSTKIDKPVLTEREKILLTIIQSGGQKLIEDSKNYFSLKKGTVCPYCLQDVSETYRETLIHSINKVLNKDVDSHKSDLESIKIPNIKRDLSIYKDLGEKLVQDTNTLFDEYETLAKEYQNQIQHKKENIYNPIVLTPIGLNTLIVQINKCLEELEKRRVEFLENYKQKAKIKHELLLIHKKLAHIQIIATYQLLKRRKADKNTIEKSLATLNFENYSLNQKLLKLQEKKANVNLAVHQINNSLSYVFCSDKRLKIEFRDGAYCLTSNGKNIRPKDASIGERNVLALCYFFSKIHSNKELTDVHKEERLIILDDPISSTDFDNRVGLLTLLKYQTKEIIKGNPESKLIFLTHDTSVFHNLSVLASSLKEDRKNIHKSYRLENKSLQTLIDNINEYKYLLNAILTYATNEPKQHVPYIGNYIRRVLEAFSTFNYCTGIDKFLDSQDATDKLGSYSKYFQSYLAKILLNTESHSELRIYSMGDDFSFFQLFSEKEICQTCRNVLCIMYLLNPDHISAYLGTSFNKETVNSWLEGLPKNEPLCSERQQ